jgi:LL-diaminopimelate aminotransferase
MNLSTAKRLQGTEEYYFSRKLREIEQMNLSGDRVINLGIGSPDLPPQERVINRLQSTAALANTHAYQSYKGSPVLRKAIADFYQEHYVVSLEPESEILPLIGSKEGILHISMTFLNDGDEVLIPDPGYPTYAAASRLAGGICIPYDLKPENNWLPDLDALSGKDLGKVKIMWVNYPHMPTGAKAPQTFFKELIQFANRHQILICHDNPYSFILNDQPESILAVDGAKEVALELNSLSKSHNMAGWRIGMLCGKSEWIQHVLRFKSNMDSGMFLPMQLAAAEALQLGKDWYQQLNAIYRQRRKRVFELLEIINCSFDSNQSGLFVWAKIPAKYQDGYALSDELLQQARVFITPGGIFGSNGILFIRVSLCQEEKVFEEAIKRIEKSMTIS